MRCFLGIALPPGPQQVLEETLAQLRRTEAPVRWVKPENLHITLKFLGELGEDHLENLETRLAKVDKPALQLALDGLGTFPPRGTPRVIWAGITPNDSLDTLQRAHERAACNAGLAPEGRKFSPHVTLARLRHSKPQAVADFLSSRGTFLSAPFDVQSVALFSARSGRGGGPYVVEET